MLAISRSLVKNSRRSFGVSYQELHNADLKLKRRLNAMKMIVEDREFNYEPPEMIYDRETGDVTILPKKIKRKSRLI